jgi:signal peptidase I
MRYAHALLGSAFLLFILLITLNAVAITSYTVDGHSMDPTLHDGQHLWVDLLSYRKTTPQMGDVVIVQYAGSRTVRFVKRVKGVPGDTVLVQGEAVTLAADQYYVVGDNLDHSTDSRVYGPILKSQILGKVWLF